MNELMMRVLGAVLFVIAVIWGVAGAMQAYDLSFHTLLDAWWGFPAYFTTMMVVAGVVAAFIFWKP